MPNAGDAAVVSLVVMASSAGTGLFIGPFAVVPVGAAVLLTSRARGLGPTVGGVAIDVAAGVGIGSVAGATFLLVRGPVDGGLDFAPVIVSWVAGSVAIAATHVLRLRQLRAGSVALTPTTLRAPTGEPAPGLRLRVAL